MPLREVTASDDRSLQDIADALAKSHKQLVITGAGISTSCGIPDFRSKDGLYNITPEVPLPTPPSSAPSTPSSRKRKLDAFDDDEPPSSQSSTFSRSSPSSRMRGQDLFHARVFQSADTTTTFYQFIAALRQKIQDEVKDTSATHKFIRTLRDGGRLIRCYTQNIDGLEAREGLCMDLDRGKGNKRRLMKKNYEAPRPQVTQNTDFDSGCEVVQLHGELSQLRCRVCSSEQAWTDEDTEVFLSGAAPKCEKCELKSVVRLATGKRGLAVGELRPNIVLYGEDHPQNSLLTPLIPFDISCNPDILIIMGTSLKVHGLQKIVRDFAKAVHNQKDGRVIFVNRTRPSESQWEGIIDEYIAMDCDDWTADLKRRREDLWLRQGELDLKQVKQTAQKKRKSVEPGSAPPAKRAKVSVNVPRLSTPAKARSSPQSPIPKGVNSNDRAQVKATGWKRRPLSPTQSAKLISPLVQRLRPDFSPITKHKGSGTTWKQAKFQIHKDLDTPPDTPNAPRWTPMTSPVIPSEKRSPLSQVNSCAEVEQITPTPHTNMKHRTCPARQSWHAHPIKANSDSNDQENFPFKGDQTNTPEQADADDDDDEIIVSVLRGDSAKRKLVLEDDGVRAELTQPDRARPTVRALFGDMMASVGLR